MIAYERIVAGRNRDTELAWQIGNFVGFKRLPPLKECLRTLKRPTLDQQFTEVMANVSILTGRDPQRVRLVRTEGGGCQLISLN